MKTRLTGLAALLALITLILGVPALLLALGDLAHPALPTTQVRDLFDRADDGSLLLILLYVAAWAAWAVVTTTVLIEIIARLRGLPAPQLTGLSWPQGAARILVSAAATLFLASQPAFALSGAPTALATDWTPTRTPHTRTSANAPSASSAAGTPATHLHATATTSTAAGPQHVMAAPGASGQPGAVRPTPATDLATSPPTASSSSSVTPSPAPIHLVRAGETLWSIAENHLGDGTRYREIAELNYGRPQADGTALTDTHWITPGWRLTLPNESESALVAPQSGTTHQVQPGETLWGIAQDELHDGTRWEEIYQSSTDTKQFDGAHLSDPHVIRPGWRMTLPERPPEPGEPAVVAQSASTPTSRSLAPVSTKNASAEATAPSIVAADPDLAAEPGWAARTISGMGAFAAAGLVSLVATRRRQQILRRRPGQPLLALSHEGPVSQTERSLRAVADELGVNTLDLALRALAHECARSGDPLPPVQVLRITPRHIEAFLESDATLPEPWQTPDSQPVGRHWRITPDQVSLTRSVALADIPTPYPALVTIGQDRHDAHLLIDLEHAGGLIVSGQSTSTRAVLAAIVVELATSSWADDVHLTVVGDFADIDDALKTGRVRYLPTLQQALTELESHAAADSAALADVGAGLDGLRAARVQGMAPHTWTPQITVVATPMTRTERERLTAALALYPGVATAVVQADVPFEADSRAGVWSLHVSDKALPSAEATAEPAELKPLGLEVFPQVLSEEVLDHLMHLATPAEIDPSTYASPVREPLVKDLQVTVVPTETNQSTPVNIPERLSSRSDQSAQALCPESVGFPELVTEHEVTSPTGPRLLFLGSVIVDGACGTVETSKRARLTELVAYLYLHPGAGHVEVDEALWPGRRHEDNLNTRNTATSKARAWLGRADDGSEYLPRHAAGKGYRLAATVGSDWAQWQELIGPTVFLATTDQLTQALRLVRGRPFDGVHPRRYGWADGIRQQMTAQIVDAAYELARRKVTVGDWRAAESAIITGLDVEPCWEPLWRLRIMAAHESGNAAVQADVIARMLSVTDAMGGDLEPETLQLLQDLKAIR